MLEDTKAALLDLDKVTVFFRQLEDECVVASKRLYQQRLTLPIQTTLLLMSSCMFRPTLNSVPLCGCMVAIEGEIAILSLQISFSIQWRATE